MRLAVPFATLAVVAALLAGCGSSSGGSSSGASGTTNAAKEPGASASDAPPGAAAKTCTSRAAGVEGLRVAGVSCDSGRQVLLAWRRASGCRLATGASRGGCSVGSYRCAGVRAERGIAVSCARPGHTVAFIAGRR